MGTTNDNTNASNTAAGPALAPLVQALMVRVLMMPPNPGAPNGVLLYSIPAGVDLKTLTRPSTSQIAHGAGMITEITAFAAAHDWTGTFGGVLPTADQTLNTLRAAVAWRAEAQAAQQWAVTARGNSQLAWDEVVKIFGALAPVLDHLIVSNPDLTRSMPATEAFLNARSTIATKAATTRKAPAVATAKAAKQSKSAAKNTAIAQAAAASNAILHPAPTPPAAPTTGNGSHTP